MDRITRAENVGQNKVTGYENDLTKIEPAVDRKLSCILPCRHDAVAL